MYTVSHARPVYTGFAFALGFLFIVTLGLLTTGCEETTEPAATPTPLNPPTNVQAYSATQTSVGLSWTPSTSENAADFNVYQIQAFDVSLGTGSAAVRTQTSAKGTSSAVVTGLTEGKIYKFEVMATATANSTTSSASGIASVTWSPARRLNTEIGGIPIKVYESASSSAVGSAIILYNAGTQTPKVVSLATPGADGVLIDCFVKTETANGPVFLNSAHLSSNPAASTWKITRFSTVSRDVSSLDDPRATPPDTSTYTASNTSLSIAGTTTANSRVYYFKGSNGNYGRILVERSTSGSLIHGTSPERYLQLRISYQTTPYNPYSKR